ncbi:alpha/beta hydrolase [Methylobacterium indicum]|nr:alpha/beta hydrolase [Methylobacterium indicum]
MPALHPDVQALLVMLRAADAQPLESLPPEAARRSYLAGRRALQPPPDEVAQIRDLAAPSPAGPVPLRLYRGEGPAPEDRLPCLVYLHGGGWVLGNIDSHDWVCRRLANLTRACVISVDYRLAPEHPFPAAVEDAAAALAFVAERAEGLGVDETRLAVGGDSAGGNLAAVLALMGRDGTLPQTALQVLLYPAVDLTQTSEGYERIVAGQPLTASTMRYFVDHYVPQARDRTDWRASPARAASLAGTAPALVLTCGHDLLCEEARAYAHRLEREGVPVTALHLSDQTHGILTMSRLVRTSATILSFVAENLRERWSLGAEGGRGGR